MSQTSVVNLLLVVHTPALSPCVYSTEEEFYEALRRKDVVTDS
jgi:hypothetical protein